MKFKLFLEDFYFMIIFIWRCENSIFFIYIYINYKFEENYF